MSKFERKFGKYAIRNLSLILIICYAVGYVLQYTLPGVLSYLTLNPYAILHGQVWRLVTWVIIPPEQNNIFFTLIMLLFYYSLGTSLENTWGAYRYNVYIFSGLVFTILGSFLFMGYCYLFHGDSAELLVPAKFFMLTSMFFSTYYINMSIFLGYAATYPDSVVYLMFILPIKTKWLGVAYAFLLVLEFIQGGGAWWADAAVRFSIGCSLLNFLIFFFVSRRRRIPSPQQMKRRARFKSQVKNSAPIAKHRCAVCGRTDIDHPELEFRFCSKCDGNYEYCQDHLFTHEHIKKH